MNREEYFMCLDGYLRKLSDEERAEAIQYYKDYFDEAGPENEQSVIENLGSPKDLAQSILDGEKSGEFTENGYRKQDDTVNPNIPAESFIKETKDNNTAKSNNSDTWMLVIGIGILIVLSPLLLSLVSTILGLIVGFVAGAFGCVIGGIILFISSFIIIFSHPGIGLMLIGCSLIMVSVGIILGLLTDLIIRVIIPLCIKIADSYMESFFGNKKH